jgi:2,4-dienoyl-CoA reductase-like NADH-dependent reductase (Old Yellow Enzyme family)
MTKTKKTNEKKPLTKEQIKNTLDEFRETAELFRQRGFNARVYGVTRSTRRGRARA